MNAKTDDKTTGKCPVNHGAGGGTQSSAWWPNQLRVDLLNQHSGHSDPLGADFDYAAEFAKLDYFALKKDLLALMLQGRDALAVLQRLCANDIDVPLGRMVYTPMLNTRGGIESDLTITRLTPDRQGDRFLIVTGSAQATRDADWMRPLFEAQFAKSDGIDLPEYGRAA